jgi:hypothetical protein
VRLVRVVLVAGHSLPVFIERKNMTEAGKEEVLKMILGMVIYIMIIVTLIWLFGCSAPVARTPQPSYKVETEMSPQLKAVVMELLWMKSDPNIFKYREPDPFRKGQ